MALRARIWGCRGSLPTPGRRTVRYGGNTSCVEVLGDDGTRVVLDAGTGITLLGAELAADDRPIHLLLTHLHLDHLEGLRFFRPLWRRDAELHIWGPPSPIHTLRDRIARAVSPPLFPLDLSDSPARVRFHDVPREAWEIGGLRIRALPVSHRGPTLGFRVEADGRALAYIPDHEPVLGVDLESLPPEWVSGHALAARADVLLHDSQFDEAQYPARVGWGHASVAHAVGFARKAEVERLVLFHHDPGRSDDGVDALRDRAAELWGEDGAPPLAAAEGMTLEL